MMNQTPNARHWMRGDLKAYSDGELTGWRYRLVAWHIERCDLCRNEAAWVQQMNGQFADWENNADVLPRPELRARILSCLPAESPAHLAQRESGLRPQVSRRPAPRLTLAFGSLATIILLMGGALALNLRQSSHTRATTVAPQIASIAQSEKRYRVVSIFPAPKNSFDAVNMVVAHSPAAPESTAARTAVSETNFTPGQTAQSTDSPSAVPVPSEETYTDPTSREAERRASLAIGKMLNERHQRLLADAKRAARSLQPYQSANVAASATPPILLAVADVSQARQQLQQWAGTMGARLRVMSEKGHTPAILAANGAPLSPGTLLEVRVPARFAGSLQTHLSQMGTPLALAGAGINKPRVMARVDSISGVGQSPVLPPPSTSLPVPAQGNDNALVTIRVRLLSTERNIQP